MTSCRGQGRQIGWKKNRKPVEVGGGFEHCARWSGWEACAATWVTFGRPSGFGKTVFGSG